MERFSDDDLRELLEALHDKYNRPEFIPDDPISVPHRYAERADREIAGFFSATIAWGNRKAIVHSGHRMMHFMDDAPAPHGGVPRGYREFFRNTLRSCA